jgi:hypothetical protein
MFLSIGKLSKHKYLKWSCILNLEVQDKNYDEKKSWGQISFKEKWKFDP